jgi:hypothetical protein
MHGLPGRGAAGVKENAGVGAAVGPVVPPPAATSHIPLPHVAALRSRPSGVKRRAETHVAGNSSPW